MAAVRGLAVGLLRPINRTRGEDPPSHLQASTVYLLACSPLSLLLRDLHGAAEEAVGRREGEGPKGLGLATVEEGSRASPSACRRAHSNSSRNKRGLPGLASVASEWRGASSRGEGGRDRGGRGGTRRRMAVAYPPRLQLHSFDVSSEFVVWAEKPGGSWLRLPRSFGDVLPAGGPGGVWLQADGC